MHPWRDGERTPAAAGEVRAWKGVSALLELAERRAERISANRVFSPRGIKKYFWLGQGGSGHKNWRKALSPARTGPAGPQGSGSCPEFQQSSSPFDQDVFSNPDIACGYQGRFLQLLRRPNGFLFLPSSKPSLCIGPLLRTGREA